MDHSLSILRYKIVVLSQTKTLENEIYPVSKCTEFGLKTGIQTLNQSLKHA